VGDRNIKQVLFGDWYQWKRGGDKERVQEGEYGGDFMYSWMKMEKWDLLKLLQ
jgi:hypothetical protein